MSSWVEASWVVQRIMEQLEIPKKIDEYLIKLNKIQQQIDHLDLTPIMSALQIEDQVVQIGNAVKNIVNTKKFAFLDTESSENNQKKPTNISIDQINKDSIWFIVEQIITEQES